MTIPIFKDIFLPEEIQILRDIVDSEKIPTKEDGSYVYFEDNDGTGISKELGRLQVSTITKTLPFLLYQKLIKIVTSVSDVDLSLEHGVYVEYSNKYGEPNLPPHFDHDSNDLIINFQMESNTSWDIGIGLEAYSLEDNSAAVFNGNEYIHWRPHKKFNDGEYVKMIFFRFSNQKNRSNYSYLDFSLDHPVFDEAKQARERISHANNLR